MKRKTPEITILLASQSARRKTLLKEMGISFHTVLSSFRETHRKHERPERTVVRNALGKASRARIPKDLLRGKRLPLILGADTVVYFRGKALGKPPSYADAVRTLRSMAGRCHDVYTGLALMTSSMQVVKTAWCRTRVKMKKWSSKKIRDYVVQVHVLDKAGSYAIQEKPGIVESYRGSYSNVVGLPKETLRKMLARALEGPLAP